MNSITDTKIQMKWYDKTEMVLLACALSSISVSFHITIWCLAALVANTLVKICCGGLRYNREKGFLWIMVAYWGLYLLSMAWTDQTATGWKEVGQLAPLALFALVFLFSDMQYLDTHRIRILFWCMTATMATLFLVRSGVALYRHRDGLFPLDYFFEPDVFDSTHHTYISIYLAAGLAFLYHEVVVAWKNGSKSLRIAICACAALLYCFLICKNSRGGHLLLCLLGGIIVFDQLVWHKKIWRAIVLIVGFTLLGIGTHYVIPNSQARQTVVMVSSEQETLQHHSDNRFLIIGKALRAAKDNLPWGVGAGDRTAVLNGYYSEYEVTHRLSPKDPHNQFADTLMTTGIPGLALLLAMIIWPFGVMLKNRGFKVVQNPDRWVLCAAMILLCPIVTALFESVLERQLGLLFFCLAYCLTAQIITLENKNKFDIHEKS
ncbi:MAG: O-antigen ligase family protein [Bacteroidales bacterium]|nr:O-antigen ligase family protein [Bacteroidales bacterium]